MAVEIDAIQSAKSIGWTDALLSRLAANSVGLGARLSITAPANASALSSTGYSLTGSNASSMIDLDGTWNTSGNPVLIKAAITNTASGSTSKFLSFLAGASGTTEVFSVDKAGSVTMPVGQAIKFGVNTAIICDSEEVFSFSRSTVGSKRFTVSAYGVATSSVGYFGFSSTTNSNAAVDLILLRDAANTLALRNGTAAQAFNVYGTYTSGSVYERMFARYSTVNSIFEIGTEQSGASSRLINLSQLYMIGSHLSGSSGGRIQFGNPKVILGRGDGAFAATFEFGSTSTDRHLTMNSDFRIRWGTSASEPAIKRSTAVLQARLADDSDYATYQGKIQTHANATAETPTATHTITIYDASGTAYRVLCLV